MQDSELNELLDVTACRLGVVGAQLAIYDGERIREFVSGYRNFEYRLPVTPDTMFQIGSTTKVLNAALIMSLVDVGRLDLDLPVCKYLDDFRLPDDYARQTITLRHLLSMTSGLDNGPYYDFGRGDDALGHYVEGLGSLPTIFPPGSAYGYSNASTNVSGHVAARVTGRCWEHLLLDRIFAPLLLEDSALFAEDLLLHPIALGYKTASGQPQRVSAWCLPRSMAPAGGLTCCSASDLIRIARMFLDKGKAANGVQVLSQDSIDEMHRPHATLQTRLFADEWCLGPCRKRWDDCLLYGHSGTNLSGSSSLLWCPKKNIAIATVVNVPDQGYPLADAIFNAVFPELFGIRKPLAPVPEDVNPASVDLEKYVGRFEAFGMEQTFTAEREKLVLTSVSRYPGEAVEETQCELIPLEEGRFLPRSLSVSGNRNWDVAFWGSDLSGRVTHVLNGVFPLRRVA